MFVLTPQVDIEQWSVLDAFGRVCSGGGFTGGGQRILLDPRNLAPGWYTLVATGTEGRNWSVRLVRR